MSTHRKPEVVVVTGVSGDHEQVEAAVQEVEDQFGARSSPPPAVPAA
jgi:hypothetical protein